MRDHKDITDYTRLGPALRIPERFVRKLTSEECLAEAAKMEERAERWLDSRDRNSDLREAARWRELAARRA